MPTYKLFTNMHFTIMSKIKKTDFLKVTHHNT